MKRMHNFAGKVTEVSFPAHKIQTYDNLFEQEITDKIGSDLMGAGWRFGHGSHPRGSMKRGYPFWIYELNDNPYYTDYLLNIIKEKTQQDYELSNVYANGHTFGTQGDFHVDWYDDSERTFLYYANDNWRPEYLGKTIFDLGSEYHYHLPKGNSAVIFPGMIPHMAEGTSRAFTGLRVTIAWKLLLR